MFFNIFQGDDELFYSKKKKLNWSLQSHSVEEDIRFLSNVFKFCVKNTCTCLKKFLHENEPGKSVTCSLR